MAFTFSQIAKELAVSRQRVDSLFRQGGLPVCLYRTRGGHRRVREDSAAREWLALEKQKRGLSERPRPQVEQASLLSSESQGVLYTIAKAVTSARTQRSGNITAIGFLYAFFGLAGSGYEKLTMSEVACSRGVSTACISKSARNALKILRREHPEKVWHPSEYMKSERACAAYSKARKKVVKQTNSGTQ